MARPRTAPRHSRRRSLESGAVHAACRNRCGRREGQARGRGRAIRRRRQPPPARRSQAKDVCAPRMPTANSAADADDKQAAAPARAHHAEAQPATAAVDHAAARKAGRRHHAAVRHRRAVAAHRAGRRDRAARSLPQAAPQPSRSPASPIEIAGKALAGKNRFDIRLDPPELGRIEVRLDVDRDGHITSHMIADRSRHARPLAARRLRPATRLAGCRLEDLRQRPAIFAARPVRRPRAEFAHNRQRRGSSSKTIRLPQSKPHTHLWPARRFRRRPRHPRLGNDHDRHHRDPDSDLLRRQHPERRQRRFTARSTTR